MKCVALQPPEGFYPAALMRAEQHAAFPVNVSLQQIEQRVFPEHQRQVLADVLLNQYKTTPLFSGSLTQKNIEALRSPNTYTVTTGQQLHIMLGPLYVLYKIADTIRLAARLKQEYPQYHFVPVFWMAGEDHDFEEISSFQFFGKTYHWEAARGGPVGRLQTDGLQPLLDEITASLHRPDELDKWKAFRECYKPGISLCEASRNFIHYLFSEKGLVCINPDEIALKQVFQPHLKAELLNGTYATLFKEQGAQLEALGLKPEALVRNPNLFYLDPTDGLRKRIEQQQESGAYRVGTEYWSREDALAMVNNQPELFSPNVLMRPLYQEAVLPNLAYICGPSEYLYWQQTALAMDNAGMPRPGLIRRNSFVIPDVKSADVINSNSFDINKLWLEESNLKSALLDHFLALDDYPQLVMSLYDSMEKSALMLHGWKSSSLKDLRASGASYIKIFEKARKDYENQAVEHADQLSDVRRYLKIAGRYFSTKHPQERREFVAGFLLNHTLLLDFITSSFIGEYGSMYLLLESQ